MWAVWKGLAARIEISDALVRIPNESETKMITEIHQFLEKHVVRGACTCGKCCDAPPDAKALQPSGHTVDMVFFKVAAKDNPDADKLRELIAANRHGEFCDLDLFDGKEHGYMEIGGWIGDQGAAIQLMGLGVVLGLWRLLSPKMLGLPDDLALQMAGSGYLSIMHDTEAKKKGAK
jgi:hypothetical protein